ncbi:hypothetical protein D910_02097 [Dendroctonus ponderosae]|uniref:Uncharacterized protein n=1 Tax=Dendroctonus ponderosae TaxID=77166 RepID=U4U3W7_DENPD|nr:hypothetical protein D910_02097 [Dendroctonus ponderosae]
MSKDTDKASLFSILRSNDVAALNEWLNTSGMNSKTVYELLGGVYEELHLRNFPLSPETRFEVEWKLVELQFSQGSCKSETSDFKNFKSTKIHLDITCQHIEQFLGKYQQLTPKIDLAFVVDAKFVALHLSVLKNRLPFSYKKLPWQEMEFLLVIFILVITKTYELDVTYGLLVDYALVRKQLEHFLNELKELQIWFTREDALSNSKSDKEQLNAINEELKKLNVKGLTGRKGNMQVILKNSPQFDDLYSHFNVVRDIYSLNCIQHYLDISSAVDLKQDFLIGSLVIQRAFQVIGEYLKDEADSPNSSSDLYFILVKLVSKNLRKTMQDLRNTLSHSHGLNKRIEIEEFKHRDAFSNIQLELKGISREIVRVLYQRKTDGLIMFLRKLDSDITMEKVQDLDSRIDISKIGKLKNGYIDIFQILTHWDFDIDEKTLPNGSTALHLAIENGHYDIVVELVKRNADCLQKTADDFTPLQLAIRAGYEDIVALIFNTSKQNMKEEETLDALMLASKYGLKDAVQILLNTGIDVNSKNDDGITALWTAAAFGQAHITKWLLSQRADVNLQNGVCSTALHVASRYGHLAVVDCLISFNADVNACNKGNHTPLHFAFENNNIDIIEKLVACPTIIVNPFSIEGMTPYHVAAEIQNPGSLKWYIEKFPEYIDICTQGKKATALHLAAGKGLLASVQLLLGHNANVNSLTAENATPLHWAIQRHGYKEIVEELIANNADPNSKNVDGATPLHVAVLNQNEDIFQILLNHRADVSLCDNTKFTPLHTACMNSSVFIVKELILKVPNVNILDDNNSTPLHHAASKGFLEAVRLLLENDADSNHVNLQNNSALHLAAFNGYQNIVQLLVAHSAEINARNSLNQTPILMAIEKLHQDVVMFLYKEGADISQNADDYKLNGTSILISALQKKSEIIAKLILEIPNIAIDVNATTASGDTALHLACSNGFTDCVEKLLSFNIDINGKTKNGLTPLHYAAYRGYDSIVKKLVLKGARVDEMANIAYPTAFSCAVANGNTKVVEFLLEHQPDVNVQ